jgi:peptidoglycan/LPS O-acetylase OafA/YrhL
MTYPFYLLHQQAGYAVFKWIGPVTHPALVAAIIVACIGLLSWATWRVVERAGQQATKRALTGLADRIGNSRLARPISGIAGGPGA